MPHIRDLVVDAFEVHYDEILHSQRRRPYPRLDRVEFYYGAAADRLHLTVQAEEFRFTTQWDATFLVEQDVQFDEGDRDFVSQPWRRRWWSWARPRGSFFIEWCQREWDRIGDRFELERRLGQLVDNLSVAIRRGGPGRVAILTEQVRELREHIQANHPRRRFTPRQRPAPHWRETIAEREHERRVQIERALTQQAAAEKRAEELLQSCLTPEQRKSLDRTGWFVVIGSDTGRRYRINRGNQMNVCELDVRGTSVRGWCFLPTGGLVPADCMLAQKIALENDEKATLKVANSFGVSLFDGATGVDVDIDDDAG